LDGERASSLNLFKHRINFAGQWLTAGCIAGVSTPPEQRLKGYSRRVMVNSLRWMRQNGCDISLLFGIQSFYPKFGYAEVLPSIEFELPTEEATQLSAGGYRFVAYKDEHLPAVLSMYRSNNQLLTGVMQRDSRTWNPFRRGIRWGVQARCRVAIDKTGKPAGYVVYDDSEAASVIEAGSANASVFPALISAAGRRARRRGTDRIVLDLPENSRLMGWCADMGLTKHTHYRRDGGAMVRMIHIHSAMDKLAPVLAERVGKGSGGLNIHTNLDIVGLAWSAGRVHVGAPSARATSASMPQWALAQLLYGYVDAQTLSDKGTLSCSKQTVSLLRRLFPTGPHHFHAVDKF